MREASLFLHKPNISGNGSAEPAHACEQLLSLETGDCHR